MIRTADVSESSVQGAAAAPQPAGARSLAPEAGRPLPGEQGPDLAAAANQLGVSEEALAAALGDASQGRPDLTTAAQALGVAEETLIEALGLPQDEPPMGGPR